MKLKIYPLFVFLFLFSCSQSLHYDYLHGSDFTYFAPKGKADLEAKRINLKVIDERRISIISCSNIVLNRRTELEGKNGFNYFKNYCRAMIDFNNGVDDSTSADTLSITLTGLSADDFGGGSKNIYGFVEFSVTGLGMNNQAYCSAMTGIDQDAPIKIFSISTRQGTLRKMASGSCRRALEQLFADLGKKHFVSSGNYSNN